MSPSSGNVELLSLDGAEVHIKELAALAKTAAHVEDLAGRRRHA